MSCILTVCGLIGFPFSFKYCAPRSRRCQAYDGYDFRYLEMLATTLRCKLNISVCHGVTIDNLGYMDIDVGLPFDYSRTSNSISSGGQSRPIATSNITFVYFKQNVMALPLWFLHPFSVKLWILLLFTAGICFPIFMVLQQLSKRTITRNNLKSSLLDVGHNAFYYLVGFLNQFPIPFETNRILHGCWLISLVLTIATYSSTIISFLISDTTAKQFQTIIDILQAVKRQEYQLAIALPRSVEEAYLKHKTEYTGNVLDYFNADHNVGKLAEQVLHPNASRYMVFFYIDNELQRSVEEFITTNQKVILVGDIGLARLINCNSIFEIIQFKTGRQTIVQFGQRASAKLKHKINTAIAAMYNSDVYDMLVRKYVYPNETAVNRFCGNVDTGPIRLKWKYIEGLVFICLGLLAFGGLIVLVEILWKYSFGRSSPRKYTMVAKSRSKSMCRRKST